MHMDMGCSRLRTVPEANTTGRKTQTEVRVEATTDMPTCFVPCTAARAAGTPRPVSYTHLGGACNRKEELPAQSVFAWIKFHAFCKKHYRRVRSLLRAKSCLLYTSRCV